MHFKKFNIYLLLLLSGIVLLTSCGSKRNTTSDQIKPVEFKQELSERQQRQFDRYFFEGLKEKTVRNYDRAEQNFLRAFKINKNNTAVQYELALIYYSNNQLNQALPYARQAANIQESNVWYNLLYASILEELNNYNDAIKVYDRLIKLKPNDRDLYLNKASIYMAAENYIAVIATLDDIEEHFGFDHDVGYRRFSIYMELNQIEKATAELKKLIELYPSELYYKTILAEVYLSHDMEEEGFAVYLEILKADPDNGRNQLAVADFYMRSEQRDSAMYYYRKAFENSTLDIDNKIMVLYSLYLADGFDVENKEEAFELSKIITKVHSNEAKGFAIYADLLYQDDQLEKAKSNYIKSIELDKSKYPVWENVLYIYMELGEYQNLIETVDEALIYFPNQAFPYFLSGIAHSQLEQYSQAISMYESALNLITDNDLFASQVNGSIADIYFQMDEQEKSDIHFEKSLELNPDNATALNNYSYYLSLRKEKLDKAEKMSARSLELEPDNAHFLDTYGWIMYQKGNYEEAKKWISKAWEKSPESHEVAHHYGDVLYRLGRIEDAISYWEIAISLGGDKELLRKKIENKTIYEK